MKGGREALWAQITETVQPLVLCIALAIEQAFRLGQSASS